MEINASAILRDEVIELSFPYSLQTIEKVRTIEGRRWNGDLGVWTIPKSPWHAEQVIDVLKDFYIDPAIKKLAKGDKIKPGLKLPKGLYNYQKDGVKFILSTNGRCIVSDAMGLGKSAEALSCVPHFSGPTLIVSPASVIYKWRDEECKRWVPDMTAEIIDGKKPILKADIHIISYSMMVNRFNDLKKLPYQTVIFDEAHYLKSTKSQRRRVANALLQSGIPHVLMLSGTPFMNNPGELFSLLNMIDAVSFPDYFKFAIRYCGGYKDAESGLWIFPKNIVTNRDELLKRLSRYLIRRTQQEVELELPELTRSYIPIDINNLSEYKKEIKTLKTVVKKKTNPLTELTMLRQIVGMGKVPYALELAETILESRNRVVLFAHHKEVVSELYKGLKMHGVRIISGDTDKKDRAKFIAEFQDTASPIKIMIITVAGAEGINLFAASDIIFVEREWTPAREEQAEARLHRIGQKSTVTAYYLVALNTVDEKISELVRTKRDTFGQVISQDEITTNILETIGV